ncbi:MAG: hypothetical protein J0H62_02150 [Rhizobiales bacterium]|nr:hypothetical protein [Hyphomicrobiales bacterium]
MQTSNFLARLIGPIWLILGISLAVHRKAYTEMSAEFVASRPLVFLAGAMALALGLSIILNHNVWSADWRIIITLFGWLALLAGVLRVLVPDMVRRVGAGMFRSEQPILITGIVWALLGAILCFYGYVQ